MSAEKYTVINQLMISDKKTGITMYDVTVMKPKRMLTSESGATTFGITTFNRMTVCVKDAQN